MSNKTINDALKDLFLALGGDATELSDNTKISDYIEDLKGALKDAIDEGAEEIIDDSTTSETKTYSSSKIESLIPAPELPSVSSSDNGRFLGVSGGKWAKVNAPSPNVKYYSLTDVATNPRLSTTESFFDIVSHIFDGDVIYINYEKEPNYISCMPIGFNYSNASMSQSSINGVIFVGKYTDNGTVKTVYLTVNSDKTVTIEEV